MHQYEDFFDLIFENLKKIIFPEEWLTFDNAMPKQELLAIMIVDKLGEITMSQISEQMNMPMSTATGIVDRLVKKSYIQRGRSEFDRRIVAITLTDQGKLFAQNLKTNISTYIKLAYDALNEEERQYLFQIFIKISSAFQNLKAENEKEEDGKNSVMKIEIE